MGFVASGMFVNAQISKSKVEQYDDGVTSIYCHHVTKMDIIFCSFFFFLLFPSSQISFAVDVLTPGQALRDNGGTLISSGKSFELGFFSPWTSNNRYIGIWFKNVPEQTPVWVANKDHPLTTSSGVLSITPAGNIVISDNQTNVSIWNSNSTSETVTNPVLQLLDTGNLVVKRGGTEDNSGDYLWQSFDYPCDTLIPGMKLGWDLKRKQEWFLRSWKSVEDPATGDYTYRFNPVGLPQIVLRRGSEIVYRSGPWDGVRFGGGPPLHDNPVYRPIFIFDANNVYYSFVNLDNSTVTRFVVNQSSAIENYRWSQTQNEWVNMITIQGDSCDQYNLCGPNGICMSNEQPSNFNCKCPYGFTPKFPRDWQSLDFYGGCVPTKPLNCTRPAGFEKISGLKLPDDSYFFPNWTGTNKGECEQACLRNCSCVAYAETEVRGCVVWFRNLIDLRTYSEGGQTLYVRLDASELGKSSKRRAVIAAVSAVLGIIVLGLVVWFIYRKTTASRRQDFAARQQNNPIRDINQHSQDNDLELPLFDLATVLAATSDFSFANQIGEGGFGPVYRGTLPTGEEIAVKRLSKNSGQGLEEFKNEVILISKLQHRNLVRMLGCCIHQEERILIYEYLSNKSLDAFLFDKKIGTSLGWGKRFDIIVGIARGLLYLHRDSRLRIIHRDLKASNILLDEEMNPKISDFGLARTFGGDQFEENTKRIVGTYGYMSPEYALYGVFSMKSDVFSFGVLILEIVSGMKNRGFFLPDHDLNLLGHAWKLWNDGHTLEFVDKSMETFSESEAVRCIQVGLLCVQQRPEERPTMSSVLLMLDSESPVLSQPRQPGFYLQRFPVDKESSSTGGLASTSNEITVTLLHGR